MKKIDTYTISLRDINSEGEEFNYSLSDSFFSELESDEVEKGSLKAKVYVRKSFDTFDLSVDIVGVVKIPCDRCLDEMEQEIAIQEKIILKLGDEYLEEDEVITISKEEQSINLAWLMYEWIILHIPLKHTHKEAECNKQTLKKLEEILVSQENETINREQKETDPRWDKLKEITNKN